MIRELIRRLFWPNWPYQRANRKSLKLMCLNVNIHPRWYWTKRRMRSEIVDKVARVPWSGAAFDGWH